VRGDATSISDANVADGARGDSVCAVAGRISGTLWGVQCLVQWGVDQLGNAEEAAGSLASIGQCNSASIRALRESAQLKLQLEGGALTVECSLAQVPAET
jgi:hypothetical protein